MKQRTHSLPIACVEGWSAAATWTGVRFSELLDLVDAPENAIIRVKSLQQKGAFGTTEIPGSFARDGLTLLALKLNGEELSIDHGYPVPADRAQPSRRVPDQVGHPDRGDDVKLRLLLGAVGVAMGAFGLLRFLQHDFGDIVNSVLWLAGGVVVHDGIIAPLTIGLTLVATRVPAAQGVGSDDRGLDRAAHRDSHGHPRPRRVGTTSSDNPTLLDRNYVLGWVVFAVVVLLVSLLTITPVWRRLVHREATRAGRGVMAAVLVVDDDPTVREVVITYLTKAGHTVTSAGDGNEALESIAQTPPELVVLDLMLPGIDGLEVCRRLRETQRHPRDHADREGHVSDRVVGLEQGADDYVTKPFSPRELVLRVDSVLRRTGEPRPAGGPVESGDVMVDPGSRVVTRGQERVPMTAREFDLLHHFVSHAGRCSRARTCCATSGAGPSVMTPRSPCTCAVSGRSSRPTRPIPRGWSPCGASATAGRRPS